MLKKTIVPLMSALFLSTALVGSAGAQVGVTDNPCGADADGDVPLVPCPEADAEAAAEAPVNEPENMVGDLSGEEPLGEEQQVENGAPPPADMQGDLSGDQPTNQPPIDPNEANRSQ